MAKGNPNIEKHGINTRFSSTNQPAVRGSKGKSITQYLKELGQGNIVEFELTITKKNGEKTTQKQTVESAKTLNQLLANRLYSEALNGNTKALKEVLDRMEGKAKQTIKIEIEADGFDVELIAPELHALTEFIFMVGTERLEMDYSKVLKILKQAVAEIELIENV